AGERRLNGDLRRLLVADFADHDFVWVVAQDGAQAAREGQALLLVHGNLRDTAKLILDGIFDGDDLVFVSLDFVDGRVKRGGLTGASGTGDQDHAVRLANVAAETAHLFLGKANNVKRKALEFLGKRFFVEDAENSVFAVAGGHDGNAEVD